MESGLAVVVGEVVLVVVEEVVVEEEVEGRVCLTETAVVLVFTGSGSWTG